MGGSRRRTAKTRTKVSIRPKKKPFTRSLVPRELLNASEDLQKKLGSEAVWDSQHRLQSNYQANGLLSDCNARFGRNCAPLSDPLKDKADIADSPEAGLESDDDLRQAEGKPRKDGRKAEPMKPTSHQHLIIKRLIEAHGTDIEAMVKDRRLNPMLLPASKLKRLIDGYQAYGDKGRCRFRTPYKHL